MQSNSLSDYPDNINLVYTYSTMNIEFRYKQGELITITIYYHDRVQFIPYPDIPEVRKSLDRLAYNFPSLVPSLPQWARKLINVL